MKSTGIVRRVDNLGRTVIPKELRRNLNILTKYEPACVFCGEASNTVNYKGKTICKACLRELVRK